MNPEKLISIKEAVDMFGLPHSTWLDACRDGRLVGAINFRGRSGWRMPIPAARTFVEQLSAKMKEQHDNQHRQDG